MRARSFIYFNTAVCAVALCHPCHAQGVSAGQSAAGMTPAQSGEPALAEVTQGLQEIIVTAERRPEKLQRTPVTAAVLSNADLQAKHVDNLQQLQLATPSLSVGEAGVTESVNIRGIGLGVSSPSVPNGVALYRDGVYQGPLLSSEPLYDMASIEVLRGPQGTFVGSNSTGGAILYRSVDPTLDKVSGFIRGAAGSYAEIGIQAAINLPISNTLAARVSFNNETRDSYFRQTGNVGLSGAKRSPGNFQQRNIRIGLLWQPSDSLRILSKTSLNRETTDGLAHVMSPANPYYDGRPLSFDLTYNVADTSYKQRGFRQSVQGDYTFSSGLSARLILGYTRVVSPYVDDLDSSSFVGTATVPPATGVFNNTAFEKTVSQEFNLISPSNGRFSWTTGIFHLWDQSNGDVDVVEPVAPTQITSRTPNYKEALTGFGQAEFKVTNDLEVQGGIRYTSSKSHNTGTLTL